MTTNSHITVRPVTGGRELRTFIRLPQAIHAGDPNWIPPLDIERRLHLSKRFNPFFDHGEGELFIAWRGDEPVGRITAQIDRLHLERYDDATGFFGHVEAYDDPAIFRALLNAAAAWLNQRGMRRLRGPFSWNINQESGLLVEGFDTPPAFMMGHARPYYDACMRAAGMEKVMDLYAYDFTREMQVPEKLRRFIQREKEKGTLEVRPIDKRRLKEELHLLMGIFNDAWAENWGFVPFTKREFMEMGQQLNFLVSERDVAIASWKGEPAAMTVVMPDLNRMIADMNGKLLPFNWLKLLRRLKFSGPPERMRMPLMGVRRKFQNGLPGAVLALSVIDEVYTYNKNRGVQGAELSWVLETNTRVRHLIESVGARHYKTYRIYERTIA